MKIISMLLLNDHLFQDENSIANTVHYFSYIKRVNIKILVT